MISVDAASASGALRDSGITLGHTLDYSMGPKPPKDHILDDSLHSGRTQKKSTMHFMADRHRNQ